MGPIVMGVAVTVLCIILSPIMRWLDQRDERRERDQATQRWSNDDD